ncbi:MAG: hypothetical protein CMP10_13700 [Zetaproteobacteria bacterium]|nr:hypothetical protein [Pseudobdellovibrionaceae bacterium]
MGILWVLERGGHKEESMAHKLIGDYAVRLFRSLDSLLKLGRLEKRFVPSGVLINLDIISLNEKQLVQLLETVFPSSPLMFFGEDHEGDFCFENWLPGNITSHSLSWKVAEIVGLNIPNRDSYLRYKNVGLDSICGVLVDEISQVREQLTGKESKILRLLLERRGECISRSTISSEVWKNVKVSPRTIDSHVSRLRKRLNTAGVLIESIYGNGYILK